MPLLSFIARSHDDYDDDDDDDDDGNDDDDDSDDDDGGDGGTFPIGLSPKCGNIPMPQMLP